MYYKYIKNDEDFRKQAEDELEYLGEKMTEYQTKSLRTRNKKKRSNYLKNFYTYSAIFSSTLEMLKTYKEAPKLTSEKYSKIRSKIHKRIEEAVTNEKKCLTEGNDSGADYWSYVVSNWAKVAVDLKRIWEIDSGYGE